MDRKSIVILIACFVLLMLWMPLVNKIFPPTRVPVATNAVATAAGTNAPPVARPEAASSTPTISAPAMPVDAWTPPAEPEELLTISTAQARYTFSSHGGGLKSVELTKYPEAVACGKKQRAANTNRWARLNDKAPLPALAYLGGRELEDERPFTLTRTISGARAQKTLANGAEVIKDFTLGTNHLVGATIRIINKSEQPMTLPAQELLVGTAAPLGLKDNGMLLGVQWYDGRKAEFIGEGWFANRFLGCFPGTPRTEFTSAGASNVAWAAVHNQFFTMIAAPAEPALRVVARRIDLPPPTAAELAEEPGAVLKPHGYQTALVYPAIVLPPGASLERRVDLFAGPKEYNTLAQLPKDQDKAMNFTTFFGWFARALLISMNGIHHLLGVQYGVAIIIITVIIKALFWPLTQASTRSMKRMAALQPQMKAIQEKYKDDPKKMNLKLMEFMKENRVSPLGGCLPILLQIPVFIGFYQMLQSAIELRGARFLWACDLSQPDTVAYIFGFPINPLPLLMGATQFWQARMTPPSPGMDPVQAKMMQYMPLIFIFILYNFSSGLALYWTVQNLISILQMKLTKNASPAAPAAAAPAGPARPPVPKRKK
ncbi:MAG: membrane protein insertase YidC [Verrucomicrobia bacterium]|nr:membrane protein insertase YidC [Verrucomicrobiota bacterium]